MHHLAARQFGLFTAAQARRGGLSKLELAQRLAWGELYEAYRGVFGFTENDADMFRFEDWAARWLALKPAADIDARRAAPDCILSHESAAVIRDLGTVVADGLYLTGPRPINKTPQVHTYLRDIGACGVEWDVFEGLPVAMPGRIVADLADAEIDGSHQGTVIADIIEDGLLTMEEVGRRLDPYAHRWGTSGGVELAQLFTAAACRSK
ncbi:hypothetical protein C0J29_32540 (plasmid) [Mycobacterium paragordonae]|uniref:Uncharacterized protein n=1 Tax=Mycobacterium paragordonae TaxID=1389713 RepID=A0ABQ1CFP8_9MYCO|nr:MULTISPECIES: type IV toxin-antitoxin system AbiEi family antitoxin domain-containing protein [Mycobacterium]AYE99697.1 hypothetical protein C0J29_32540 [Mycobacterium paragordonae]BDE17453.1 hypothetical protein MKCMC460_63130 [Mycobacterium sp. 20KCMC460]GFG83316.1 hypothetical protein MPRG_65920 [Mycobacterium paragordonae]GLC23479.1 hypothetical protein SRL2020472_60500 [Mycobacterium kiyosense]